MFNRLAKPFMCYYHQTVISTAGIAFYQQINSTAVLPHRLMVGATVTSDSLISAAIMDTRVVDFSTTELPPTPALDWKEFFGK